MLSNRRKIRKYEGRAEIISIGLICGCFAFVSLL